MDVIANLFRSVVGGRNAANLSISDPKVLTNAQIKALPTTRVELVPAPASGLIIPALAVLRGDFSAGAYTGIDADGSLLGIELNASAGYAFTYLRNIVADSVQTLTDFLGVADELMTVLLPYHDDNSPNGGILALPQLVSDVDGSLAIFAANALDFTGGHADNTLTVTVAYLVL